MNRFHYAVLIIVVSVLGGAWTIISQETVFRSPTTTGLTEGPQAGFLAPVFVLRTYEGQEIDLAELRGSPVVLNFWATWCPPCRAEMPHLEEASQRYSGRATILGVDQGETAAQIRPFAEEFNITFPLLVDETNQVNQSYGVRALPTTFFIDENGVIDEVFTGILNRAVLEDRLNNLLEG